MPVGAGQQPRLLADRRPGRAVERVLVEPEIDRVADPFDLRLRLQRRRRDRRRRRPGRHPTAGATAGGAARGIRLARSFASGEQGQRGKNGESSVSHLTLHGPGTSVFSSDLATRLPLMD
jgi:hypothetical protein